MAVADGPHPLRDLQTHGLLWLINRTVFHPRGLALALGFDDDGEFVGWKMLGDGSEVWWFSNEDDEESFAAVSAYLSSITETKG